MQTEVGNLECVSGRYESLDPSVGICDGTAGSGGREGVHIARHNSAILQAEEGLLWTEEIDDCYSSFTGSVISVLGYGLSSNSKCYRKMKYSNSVLSNQKSWFI